MTSYGFVLGCGIALVVGAGAEALAQDTDAASALAIEHVPLACALSDQFPRVEAAIRPPDLVEGAWVRFRTSDAPGWYAVRMMREEEAFVAHLPRPRWADEFEYYVDAMAPDGEARTEHHRVRVEDRASRCTGASGRRELEAALLVESPPDNSRKHDPPPVPPGFSARGTVGDIGLIELPGRTTGLITAGLIAAGAGVAIGIQNDNPGLGIHEKGPEPPPVVYTGVRFVLSVPDAGSTISPRETLQLFVHVDATEARSGAARADMIRFDFFSGGRVCSSISTFLGNLQVDQIARAPFATTCDPPFTVDDVTVTFLRQGEPFPDTPVFPLGIGYTVVP